MSDLRAPDSIEAQVRDVMNVNPADPASRQMARRVVEALGRGGVSEARSRMLDRQVLALAQADPGSAKTWSELQRLASKAHELDAALPAPRKGLLGRLLPPARRSPEQAQTTIEEMDAAVSALTSSAEVLRQNDVALDGYEADLVEELQRVEGDVQRADELYAALTEAVRQARVDGTPEDVVRFVQREVLDVLEGQRLHLQELLAVDQQAAMALAFLRDNNTLLIGHVRQITLAAKQSLALARTLGRHAPQVSAHEGSQALDAGGAAQDTAEVVGALQESLDQLFSALEAHDAWRSEVAAQTQKAVVELRDLSAEVFEDMASGVSS